MKKNIFLTGTPSSGKTTVIKKIIRIGTLKDRSSKRRPHGLRPLTPPYVRDRIRRFMNTVT